MWIGGSKIGCDPSINTENTVCFLLLLKKGESVLIPSKAPDGETIFVKQLISKSMFQSLNILFYLANEYVVSLNITH